jgi:hypothetical protein
MCFSATASFSAAVVLIPVGVYCIKKAVGLKSPYWTFAILPLMFGIQQIFEGLVWLEFDPGGGGATRLPALGFLFFSHVFWLFWIPFACYIVENSAIKKKVFIITVFIGAAHGLIMYIPLWFNKDWLIVELLRQSIEYKASLFYDEYVPRIVVRVFYGLIVITPLVFSSDRYIKIFGIIIAISVAIATVFFGYAFISVWCYFAAILSLYILFMILQKNQVITKGK